MPIIYLSPSTQENNLYVSGGTEEEWMNRLADAMEPYLTASGIRFSRNTPEMTAVSSIQASNAGTYDLHLALHSNAAPEGKYGQVRGILAFYYPGSVQGQKAANLIANGLKTIYPLPNLVRTQATTTIGEVRRVRAPAVFLELGYHDNPDDAAWVKNNLNAIARNIVLSLTEYFGLPFLEPQSPRPAVVDVSWGYLNIRDTPSLSAPVLARAYDGARLTVLNQWENWYVVRFDGLVGWASADFITLI
ncbi:N-acetylmuramoyl-L-alanine amidase [Intestinimonas massiliensis (ex Afouda et al. 2020)]|uniref:N-acetylmuramoyl-L-alanine amidase n=1 Tax=Intestinimonas massiliensis (ex Afouda et al. 2020) TaxID=1673721 RepID=UPI0010323935|nr:N-acetylmuramoyl-L-alanine amidase [Intestinimonas massiliensis (ex Afouda et al. 2020)]